MNQLELYQPQNGALFDERKLELLKNTICKGATNDEFDLFLHACNRTGLDPFMRQIYAVKRWNGASKREEMTIQTGIDGYRLIAERTGKYSPGREPLYTYDSEGRIISATSFVKKQTADGSWHEVAATAFFNEYCQKTKEGKPTRFWMQMAHTMLAKCAEALALRKAFPGDLSNLYTKEEMMQAEKLDIEGEVITNLIQSEGVSKTSQDASINHSPDVRRMVDNIPKVIDKSQWTELNQLIDQCSPPFQQKIWDRLAAMGIQSMEELDEDTFIKMRNACLGNIAKQNNIKNQDQALNENG